MYSKVTWIAPNSNSTLEELNNELVKLHIPTLIFIGILMVVGVMGNILVIFVYTRKYGSSTHRCFILSLAGIDIVSCCVGMPLLIFSMLYPYQFTSPEACKTLRFLHVFLVCASAFIVLAIASERHRRICSPFSKTMSTKNIKMICLVAMAMGILVAIPAIPLYGPSEVETGVNNITGTECFVDRMFENSLFPQIYFSFQLILCIISFVVLGIYYFRIGRQIWWHHTFIRDNTFSSPNRNTISLNKDKIRMKSVDKSAKRRDSECFSYDNGVILDPKGLRNEDQKRHSNVSRSSTSSTLQELDDVVRKTSTESKLNLNTKRSLKALMQNFMASRNRTRASKSNSTTSTVSNCGGYTNKRTKEVTTMLFIITVVFVMSFVPHLVLMVLMSIDKKFLDKLNPVEISVFQFFLRTFVINNMANPIIYGFCDPKFRRECQTIFFRIISCGRHQ
ncbi:hypothetical protein CHS0354_026888 [Potamilus streckersoni]|uniref:G-protein coupled receptors family 1 profile domain-containing protein n=1 Tax=Potamilus streckersoni TaxID=2493646 RepID=A0AAE0SP41_9BIVA|nr:hypothetical protein CHS0354_026888 [Potamilus streckersoni]